MHYFCVPLKSVFNQGKNVRPGKFGKNQGIRFREFCGHPGLTEVRFWLGPHSAMVIRFHSFPYQHLVAKGENLLFCLQLIDTNQDGVVTIDELVEWCSRDEQILQSLETSLDTVL